MNERVYQALTKAQEDAVSNHVIEWAGEPVKSVKKAFQRMSKRSGVHCAPHMLRHSAAVWMAEDKVPMSQIAQFLGHSNSTTTERVYAKYSPDYLRAAARSLDW